MARREHVPEGREDAVEAVVGERKLLGVALDPLDLDPCGLGPGATGLKQFRRRVKASDMSARASRRKGSVAGSAGDVKHRHPRVDARARYDPLTHVADQLA
jgi:hypothetical protein